MLKPLGGAKGKRLKGLSAPQAGGERSPCFLGLVEGGQHRQPPFTTAIPKEQVE